MTPGRVTHYDSSVVSPPGAVSDGSDERIAWIYPMAQKLSTQLRNFGCDLAPVEFKRVLATAKRDLFPEMTDEHLVCTDEENATYCEEVRRRLGRDLPRPFIRFQLLNVRKSQAQI
jgi:hypothetical protein